MPTSSVAAATLNSESHGVCPNCHKIGDLYTLSVSISRDGSGRVVSEQKCVSCLCGDCAPMIKIKLSDVMDTKGPRRTINKTARKRERECAEDIRGRTTPASGSGISKGDAVNDAWMVDDKFTISGNTFRLGAPIMLKALAEATKTGRRPVLRIGLLQSKINMAVMMWDDFVEVICGEG